MNILLVRYVNINSLRLGKVFLPYAERRYYPDGILLLRKYVRCCKLSFIYHFSETGLQLLKYITLHLYCSILALCWFCQDVVNSTLFSVKENIQIHYKSSFKVGLT